MLATTSRGLVCMAGSDRAFAAPDHPPRDVWSQLLAAYSATGDPLNLNASLDRDLLHAVSPLGNLNGRDANLFGELATFGVFEILQKLHGRKSLPLGLPLLQAKSHILDFRDVFILKK